MVRCAEFPAPACGVHQYRMRRFPRTKRLELLPKGNIGCGSVENRQHSSPVVRAMLSITAKQILKNSGHVSRRTIAAITVGLLLLWPAESSASDWIYRRSYFSHDIPPEESGFRSFPQSRSAYRRAYVNASPGFAVRGGYRFNRIFMRDGASTDLTVIREDWFQVRP
jgi:hypothetical protein